MDSMQKQRTSWGQKILHEIREYWFITLYMAILFAVFTIYRRLILTHHLISYEEYGISVIKVLILAKVVLTAEKLRLGRGLEDKSLIVPTLYKSFLFTICVALFGVVESMMGSFIHGKGLTGAVDELMSQYTYISFFAVRELSRVLGAGKIGQLFFRSGEAAESDLITRERS